MRTFREVCGPASLRERMSTCVLYNERCTGMSSNFKIYKNNVFGTLLLAVMVNLRSAFLIKVRLYFHAIF